MWMSRSCVTRCIKQLMKILYLSPILSSCYGRTDRVQDKVSWHMALEFLTFLCYCLLSFILDVKNCFCCLAFWCLCYVEREGRVTKEMTFGEINLNLILFTEIICAQAEKRLKKFCETSVKVSYLTVIAYNTVTVLP